MMNVVVSTGGKRFKRRPNLYVSRCSLLIKSSALSFIAFQTIENMRVKDETMVTADDDEVAADEEQDEFS
eukprot:scaffold139085_cov17-Tisochrysis_lutea.AAC.1